MSFKNIRFQLVCFVAALGVVASVALSYHRLSRYDLLIINARIVDGTGNPWFRGDIAVDRGRIVKIGSISEAGAARTIDAKGQVVGPGFIDVHTHVEDIRRSPSAENFVRMGVTTVVTGNCGSSAIDVSRFYEENERSRPAVNVATLIGHNSVRSAVMHSDNRDPTPEELELMKRLVEQGMKDGALGLSTGLIYIPGAYAKTDEIISLARVAARYGGIYATHMRDEGPKIAEGIEEAIRVGEDASIPVEISHFKVTSKKLWDKSLRAIELVKQARERGLSVTVDQYAYTASSTSLDVILPEWVREGGREAALQRLEDKDVRDRAIRAMKTNLAESGFEDYSYAVVASYMPDASFNGKSIVEITRQVHDKSTLDSQIEQILDMYKEGGASMVYHKMSENDVQEIMRQPFTSIASDSGVRRSSEDIPHPRGYGNNVRVLGRYVRELGLIPLEDAVRKMTSLPAQVFRLRDRGLVRVGMAADLVIFDEKTVADLATFEQPRQYPVGISHVIVNGKVVWTDGVMSAERPGEVLRRTGPDG
jgi:N-acyl-D-amino-acid deacylase